MERIKRKSMKPFRIIIDVDKDGKSKLVLGGQGKAEITQAQIVVYLAGELEKFELEIAIDNIEKKMMEKMKKQMQGIQLVKNLPLGMKNKQ